MSEKETNPEQEYRRTARAFDELDAMMTKDDARVASYDVPGIGKFDLMKSSRPVNQQAHGAFYTRMEGRNVPVRLCYTEDELRLKTGEYVFKTLKEKETGSQQQLPYVKDSLLKMSVVSVKRNLLDHFEVK